MRNTLIAKRYAKALFDFALEQNLTEQVRTDMEIVLRTLSENKELRLMLKSPVIKAGKKETVVSLIFEDHIQTISMQYLRIIIRKRREAFIEGIAAEFTGLYKKYKNIITAYMQTATAIDEPVKDSILRLLEQQTGAEIELIAEVDKDLIGGFVLRYEDKKYDASIRRQLSDLRKEFNINLYERKL